MSFELRSTAFAHGAAIPAKYTRQGGNMHPPLSWSGVPAGTRELALVVEDPDAPGSQPFVHWIAYGIPATLGGLPEGASGRPPAGGIREGSNSFGKVGYDGPAPPPGHPHHYHFKLYALDHTLDLGEKPDKKALLAATKGHTLAEVDLMGTYQSTG